MVELVLVPAKTEKKIIANVQGFAHAVGTEMNTTNPEFPAGKKCR
jgi:hypothetical protein